MTEQDARDFMVALGAEITAWRKRRRLTRAQLASRVGLSETTIGRIERGGTDAAVATSDVWRIARALGLAFSDLVRRAEEAERLSDGAGDAGAAAGTAAPYSFDGAQQAARAEDAEVRRLQDD